MSWVLVADIGGTNMRLAAGADGRIVRQQVFATVGEISLGEAIRQFVRETGSKPQKAAFAAAGIVENGAVTLTNAGTIVSEEIINEAAGITNARVLNDFEAAAWSLADVNADEVITLQGSEKLTRNARVIIGPGTGLGVGALVWQDGMPVVVQGEGGHVRLSPDTPEELAIFKALCAQWPQTRMGDGYAVEAEAVLSGTGLPYFYRAIAEVDGHAVPRRSAAQIFDAARSGDDPSAEKAVRMFAKYLGELAGDMAVTFAARGGIFLAGGVISANPWIFEDPAFLPAFNSGGRHTWFRETIPIYLYKDADFGLNGALNYLKFGGRGGHHPAFEGKNEISWG